MQPTTHPQRNDRSRAWLYINRGLKLRCPECGVSPVFVPLKKVRSLFDWFTPCDGCPRCGYAYQREAGYFLLAIWGLNYGIVAGLAVLVAMLFEWLHPLTMRQYILFVLSPMPIVSFLLARHAKSLFLAMDHYLDPHNESSR
ncbi:MAG TPA: hypothetical protein VKK61_00075 [Tepidisphaeraceae bacterium]|nr:hypothetical protein [Tepidisphaeraceae bacterium]